MRIIYMGTPDFAVPSLETLIANDFKPVCVVTGPDRPRGRGRKWSPTPVKKIAAEHGIPVMQPESVKDPAFAADVAALQPDLIVVVAFRILPPGVFGAARLGAFNLHASLLPAFRGAAPIQRALMAGATRTGVTTFFLKEKVDTGNVILRKEIPVGPNETAGSLHDRLMMLGAEAVLETVTRIQAGTAIALEQDDRLATPAPKISKEDARIRWDEKAETVHNQIRGLSPMPGAWTMHGEVLMKILRTRVGRPAASAAPGTVVSVTKEIEIACGKGTILVDEIQREGKAKLSAEDFVNGYRLVTGDRLE